MSLIKRLSKRQIKLLIEHWNKEKREMFTAFGGGGQYTERQKEYAFELIDQSGMRATAKILKIPRRTLQRWCRKNHIYVKRCPDWLYGWVESRRKRRDFWRRRGYG